MNKKSSLILFVQINRAKAANKMTWCERSQVHFLIRVFGLRNKFCDLKKKKSHQNGHGSFMMNHIV